MCGLIWRRNIPKFSRASIVSVSSLSTSLKQLTGPSFAEIGASAMYDIRLTGSAFPTALGLA
jgi:hypothetical protein